MSSSLTPKTMKVADLRTELERRGQPTNGLKPERVDRLQLALDEEEFGLGEVRVAARNIESRQAAAEEDPPAEEPAADEPAGDVPASNMVVPFAMLLNLASVSGAEDKETLWGFMRRYAPEATPATHPDLDNAAACAVRYFKDFVAPTRQFRAPDARERAALEDLKAELQAWDGGLDAEELQSMVFAIGKAHAFEPLRDWFKALYEVLLGASQGPRFGGFIALYGIFAPV